MANGPIGRLSPKDTTSPDPGSTENMVLGSVLRVGGDDGNRTHDLFIANEALCQLSYIPDCSKRSPPGEDRSTYLCHEEWENRKDSYGTWRCLTYGHTEWARTETLRWGFSERSHPSDGQRCARHSCSIRCRVARVCADFHKPGPTEASRTVVLFRHRPLEPDGVGLERADGLDQR